MTNCFTVNDDPSLSNTLSVRDSPAFKTLKSFTGEGNGLTVISTVTGVPPQVPIAGVTVYLTTAGELVLLVNVWAILLPLPLE